MIRNLYSSSRKVKTNIGQISMKLEFSGQIFGNYSNIKFLENPSSGNRVVPCKKTDRHDEAIGRFCNSANARKKRQHKYLKLHPINSMHIGSAVT